VPIYKGKFSPPNQLPAPPNPTPLFQVGPIVEVQIAVPTVLGQQLAKSNQPIPQPVTGIALIDTGATLSAVGSPVLAQLGLNPVGTANVGTAGGQVPQNLYPTRMTLTRLNLSLDYNAVLGVDLTGQSIIALLGRDFLQSVVLIYDGPAAEFTLAF
jgi:hypothetical protein